MNEPWGSLGILFREIFFFLYMIGENIEHELLQGLDAMEGKSHKHCEIQGLIESIFKQNSAQHGWTVLWLHFASVI